MSKKLWTIGHSTHTLEEFMSLLHAYHIEILVDVRSLPGSQHLLNLGGRRKASKTSKNTVWRNASFRGYADYMETDAFKEGIETLKKLAEHKKVAIMCSEIVWWRCHRSMIADELKSEGWTVIHILSLSKSDEHPYTAPAKIVNGKLNYTNNL